MPLNLQYTHGHSIHLHLQSLFLVLLEFTLSPIPNAMSAKFTELCPIPSTLALWSMSEVQIDLRCHIVSARVPGLQYYTRGCYKSLLCPGSPCSTSVRLAFIFDQTVGFELASNRSRPNLNVIGTIASAKKKQLPNLLSRQVRVQCNGRPLRVPLVGSREQGHLNRDYHSPLTLQVGTRTRLDDNKKQKRSFADLARLSVYTCSKMNKSSN